LGEAYSRVGEFEELPYIKKLIDKYRRASKAVVPKLGSTFPTDQKGFTGAVAWSHRFSWGGK